MKLYKSILFFLLLSICSYAQVSVKLQQPPPYQFKVEQFWKIILFNNSDQPVNVYLKGTATESLQGKIVEATSSIITLPRGVKNITGRDLAPFTVSESNNNYKNIILNTGSIPSGSYDICVSVFDAADGREIASDCIQASVENFNRMELISPMDGEVLGIAAQDEKETNEPNDLKWKNFISKISNKKKDKDWDEAVGDFKKKINKNDNRYIAELKKIVYNYKDDNPHNADRSLPNIAFSWLPPVPVPPGVNISYKLKLVEILGYQSVFAAMSSNPLYYQSSFISATILSYPVAAKKLMQGRKYAWSVEVYINGSKIQESEIRTFEIAGDDKSELHEHNYNNSNASYVGAGSNNYSGLPSGLSVFSNRNYNTISSHFFSGMMQNESGDQPLIKVYGNAKFTQESRSKAPPFSQLPANTKSLEINPSVSIWDIPFGLNIYLSSMNSSNRQSINSISFNFDLDQLKSKITDRLEEKASSLIPGLDSAATDISNIGSSIDTDNPLESAEKLGLLSGSEKFFMDFKALGIGKTYPSYSELTVNGVLVNGLNIEYNPGMLYIAFAAGNNSEAIDNISLKRNFISGRLGLGEKENSHLIFTLLKMKDDQNNIPSTTQSAGSAGSPLSPSTSSAVLTPQENVVFGTDMKLSLFDKVIAINGEGAVSGFTRNLNDADYSSDSVPELVKKLIVPKLSTSFDYAWKGQLEFNNQPSSTRFKFTARRTGPGFTSLAAPNLKQDQLQYNVSFDQKFVNKKITLKTFLKTYSDNLIDWKQSTTKTISYGINLGFNFPKLPFLQISYSPYSQKNDAVITAQKMENSSDMFSITTGYSYQISDLFASTIFSFNNQMQKSKIGIMSNDFSNRSYMINQSLSFEIPLTLSSTLNISQSKIMLMSSRITDFDLNGNYQINEAISANIGGTISNEEHLTKRTVLYFGSNIVAANWIKFELQGNISSYKDLSGFGQSYNDGMFQLSVIFHW